LRGDTIEIRDFSMTCSLPLSAGGQADWNAGMLELWVFIGRDNGLLIFLTGK